MHIVFEDKKENLNYIYDLLSKNEFDKALDYCNKLLTINSDDSEVFNILSFIYNHKKIYDKAINKLQQAIRLQPENPIYHNNLSLIYKNIGNLNAALLHINEALRINPNYAEAHNNLGNIYLKQKLITKAIDSFEKAIRLYPNYLEAHINLANALIKDDRFDKAISHYETALKISPENLSIKQNLAMAYIEKKQCQAAILLLEEVINNKANFSFRKETYIHLAESYLDLGKVEQAIKTYIKAIELNPKVEFLHHNLAILLLREQDEAGALRHFKKVLQINPENETAQHMIASLTGLDISESPPSEYVERLFDQYADYYNDHLQKKLNYKIPSVMRQKFSKYISPASNSQNILDLGCGTGLCSIYFRDLAFNLIGIDLSYNMLLQAKNLTAYDLLIKGNILEAFPGENDNFFNIILAADVFCYIGNLQEIFTKSRNCLQEKGKLIFTVESLDKNNSNNNYTLNKSGRYSHNKNYIFNLASRNNFKILENEELILRKNNQQQIKGIIFLLEKI